MSRGIEGYARLVLCIAIAVLTGVLAQVSFWVGPVPYTLQNVGVVLAGLLLDPLHAFLSAALYTALIALGLPMATGFRGGIHVILGYTGGYIVGFTISAPLMSLLRRWYTRLRGKSLHELSFADCVALLLLSLVAVLPTYALGFVMFTYHALGSERLLTWATKVFSFTGLNTEDRLLLLFTASVLVFIPQDLLMDHVIALALAKYIYRIALFKGVELR
jgi:biotin transport system substrate-specific component